MDRWSNIYQIVYILFDNIYVKYYTELIFAWCTDTSIGIQIEWMPVVSVFNNIFVSAVVE